MYIYHTVCTCNLYVHVTSMYIIPYGNIRPCACRITRVYKYIRSREIMGDGKCQKGAETQSYQCTTFPLLRLRSFLGLRGNGEEIVLQCGVEAPGMGRKQGVYWGRFAKGHLRARGSM